MELNKIHNICCFDLLKDIPDKCVDLVITDPPYLKKYSTGHRKNVARNSTEIMNDRTFDYDRFFDEILRVIRPEGHMYVFGCWQTGDYFKKVIEKRFKIKNRLVWVKNNWTAGDLFWSYGQSYEDIWFCTNGRKRLNGRRDRDCLLYDRVVGKNQLHLNQKPLELIKFLMTKSSIEGDIVLDPFMGSATTAAAAMELNRNYIGSELDKRFYDIGEERIKDLGN